MAQYRKKPVVIDAVQWDGVRFSEMPDWLYRAMLTRGVGSICLGDYKRLSIQTLEGKMTAESGDWIIRGIKGEIYSCKPDIFAETYEVA